MTWQWWCVWIGLALIGFAGSALYSGIETGAYRLNRVRLHIRARRGEPQAVGLESEVGDLSRMLTSLLIGNNITNQIGTSAVGVMLLTVISSEGWAIVFNALVVTPILFVVGETIPKDFFSANADSVMYRLAPVLRWSRRFFTAVGLLPMVGVAWWLLTRVLGGGGDFQATHPRRQMTFLFKEGAGHGLLSDQQTQLVDRVMRLTDMQLSEAMTPWGRAKKVRLTDPPSALWRLAEHGGGRSRYPVVDREGKVVGVVNVLDALVYEQAECPPIESLLTKPVLLSAGMGLRAGLTALQDQSGSLAVVVDERERPLGVVTPRDLVEPITGHLAQW